MSPGDGISERRTCEILNPMVFKTQRSEELSQVKAVPKPPPTGRDIPNGAWRPPLAGASEGEWCSAVCLVALPQAFA